MKVSPGADVRSLYRPRSMVFAEPAGAAPFAGLVKAVHAGLVEPDDRIVVLATGSGLKDVQATMRLVGKPRRIEPSLKAVKAALRQIPVEFPRRRSFK